MRKWVTFVAAPVLLLCVGLPAWVAVGSRDLPDPGDADLWSSEAAPTPGHNAYPLVAELAAGLNVAGNAAALEAALAGDPEATSDLLQRHQARLDALHTALEQPALALPEASLDDDGGSWTAWIVLAKLLALRSAEAAERGEWNAAFRDALVVVRLGARLESAHGATLLQGALGLSVKQVGLKQLARLARSDEVDADRTREVFRTLDAQRSSREAWDRVWAAEYRIMTAGLSEAPESGEGSWFWRSPESYAYHPNRTRALYAAEYRRLQRNASLPCAQRELSPYVDVPGPGPVARARLYLGPNAIGEILASIAMGGHDRYDELRCAAESSISAAQATLALRAYERAHGELPGALDALVPTYLPLVPTDAHDGESLRYSAVDRRLWSRAPDSEYPLPF